uniref:Uncharacterized protein n=1 Tax=Acrobeloides nanus TaxID=290746 RepID=A0A914C5V4_9BILA
MNKLDSHHIMSRLKLLTVDNQRRLLNVLVTLNLRKCNGKVEENNELLAKLDKYLQSAELEEKILGIIGYIQHVKALLLYDEDRESKLLAIENEIENTLIKIAQSTKDNYRARAVYFYEFTELLKTPKLPKSKKLLSMCDLTNKNFKKRFFIDHIATQRIAQSQFEAPQFVNQNCGMWIDIDELVLKEEPTLEGSIIPYLLFLQQFALYKKNFSEEYENFEFVLKSNISLSRVVEEKNTRGESREEKINRCNVLYFAVEWIRTVLNMFAEFQRDDKKNRPEIDKLIEKKFDLLMEVEGHLIKNIKRIEKYEVPNISRHLPKNFTVNFREKADVKKVKKMAEAEKADVKKVKKMAEAGVKNMANRNAAQRQLKTEEQEMSRDMDHDDTKMSRESLERMGLEVSIADAPEGNNEELDESRAISPNDPNLDENSDFWDFILPKPKQVSVNVEKLRWYFTPLNLSTIVRLVEINHLKRSRILFLVENLHLLLKYAIPTPGKQVPIGFGVDPPVPHATLDYGSKETIWKNIALLTPLLFELLNNQCVDHFIKNPPQDRNPNKFTDSDKLFMSCFKMIVQIFARVFQSKDLSTEVDPDNIDDSFSRTDLRHSILSQLCKSINVFNASKQPLNLTDKSKTRSTGFNFIDDDSRASAGGEDTITPVVEYFLEIAKFAPTIETGSALLEVLKLGSTKVNIGDRDERYAETALAYLARDWTERGDVDKSVLNKECLKILNHYIDSRVEKERIAAIAWLLEHSFSKMIPVELFRKHNFDIICFKDREEIVGQNNDSQFPCINETNIIAVHAVLYKKLNNSVIANLHKKQTKNMRSANLINEWEMAAQSYMYLNIISRIEDIRKHGRRLLLTCVRESRRFTEFFMSKNSSFMEFFTRPPEEVKRLANKLNFIHNNVQISNRIVQSIMTYAKVCKLGSILKLIPDLRATQDRFVTEIHNAWLSAGLSEAVKYGIVKTRDIDGKFTNNPEEILNKPKPSKRPRKPSTTTIKNTSVASTTSNADDPPPKKRGRQKKNTDNDSNQPGTSNSKAPVKRGRKPKNT